MAAAPEVQATSAIASVPLYYNRAGFDDVVGKTFGLEGGLGLAYSLDVELTDYIWHLTSGHSQAVGLVFQSLADYFVSIHHCYYNIEAFDRWETDY